MMLSGSNGSVFELDVIGYQFPTLETEEYDSNWLRIGIHAIHPKGHWRSVDPSLLTYELEHLARWFDSIGRGEPVQPDERFTEPNLSFRLVEGGPEGKVLRVYFELESRPGWARAEKAPAEDLWVEFPLAEIDLSSAARDLRAALARFPQRAER